MELHWRVILALVALVSCRALTDTTVEVDVDVDVKGIGSQDVYTATDVRKTASADVRRAKRHKHRQREVVKEDTKEIKEVPQPKKQDRKTCNIELKGSTVREDFQIKGRYEYLNGVTFSERPTYYNSNKKFFLFYLESFSCWAIGPKAGAEDNLASYVSDSANHPLDNISGNWHTALAGEWTADPKLFMRCEGEDAVKSSTKHMSSLDEDQVEDEDEVEDDEDEIPAGYEFKQGYLTARDSCHIKSTRMDHYGALSHCWETSSCQGITYQSPKIAKTKPVQIWFKSCIEFHPSKDWITFIKKEDEYFQAREVDVVFVNELPEDVILFLKHVDEEDEEWGLLRTHESFEIPVKTGSSWFAKFENGTHIHSVTISTFGRSEGNVYTFNEAKIADEIANQKKEEYFEETGRSWLQVWPRPPPIHPMWDTLEIGHTRTVTTTHHQWHIGDSTDLSDASVDGDLEKPPLELEMETMSLQPKVFVIKGALSDDECDYIVNKTEGKFVRSKILADQTHKDYDPDEDMVETISKVRTSTQTWISSNSSAVIKNIFFRIGDLLRLDNNKLNSEAICESLQVVHYEQTQEYRPHHDYMEPYFFPDQSNIQKGYNRFATILFYVHPAEEGGGTGFPLAKEGNLEVRLPKGSAVLFYNMLEDGNLDYYSQHAGLPVKKGTKFASNLWIWDPLWGGHL